MVTCGQVRRDLLPSMRRLVQMGQREPAFAFRERGFSVCAVGTCLKTGKECVGESCSVKISGCKKGRTVGSFHTHPAWSTDIPSTTDVSSSFYNREKFLCIGNAQKNPLVRCFELDPKHPRMRAFIQSPKMSGRHVELWYDMLKTEEGIKEFCTIPL